MGSFAHFTKGHGLPKEASGVTAQAFPPRFQPHRGASTQMFPQTARGQTRSPGCRLGPEAVSLYLQMPAQRPRGGTNPSPCPRPGGASGQGLCTWICPTRTRRRTRTHLNETHQSVRTQHRAPATAPFAPKETLCCSYPNGTQLEKRRSVKMPRPTDSLRGQPAPKARVEGD